MQPRWNERGRRQHVALAHCTRLAQGVPSSLEGGGKMAGNQLCVQTKSSQVHKPRPSSPPITITTRWPFLAQARGLYCSWGGLRSGPVYLSRIWADWTDIPLPFPLLHLAVNGGGDLGLGAAVKGPAAATTQISPLTLALMPRSREGAQLLTEAGGGEGYVLRAGITSLKGFARARRCLPVRRKNRG